MLFWKYKSVSDHITGYTVRKTIEIDYMHKFDMLTSRNCPSRNLYQKFFVNFTFCINQIAILQNIHLDSTCTFILIPCGFRLIFIMFRNISLNNNVKIETMPLLIVKCRRSLVNPNHVLYK